MKRIYRQTLGKLDVPLAIVCVLGVAAVAYAAKALTPAAGDVGPGADVASKLGYIAVAAAFAYVAVLVVRDLSRKPEAAPADGRTASEAHADYDWLESRVAGRVTEWCGTLGWEVVPRGRTLRVTPPGGPAAVTVFGARSEGVPYLHVTASPARGVLPRDVLEFALRRSHRLVWAHWCFDPYDGLLVRAVDPLARMNVERFRELVGAVIHERDDAVRVAAAELGVELDQEGGGTW